MVINLPADSTGSLLQILKIVQAQNVSVLHVETRPSKKSDFSDVFLKLSESNQDVLDQTVRLVEALPGVEVQVAVGSPRQHLKGIPLTAREEMANFPDVPWFATTMQELIEHNSKTLQCGEELGSDHPSFTDAAYRSRRQTFADIGAKYVLGQPIPYVEYNAEETATWGEVYRQLTNLYPTHACETYNRNFQLLIKHLGLSEHKIPQMEDISNFLRSRTGFRLRPSPGLVDFRDYLAGLAFRVFQATQYIRHHSSPQYTPEPDICHEYLGHVPLFCDPEFAQFSQEIGLASLGAPDEWIEKLGNLYWYTVEFGLCRENNGANTRVYGGALLSSFGELERCLTDDAKRVPLDPDVVAATPYPITRFQDVYFVAESFQDMREKLAGWITQIPRPFSLRYNAYTSSVEVLHKKEHLRGLVRDIETDIKILKDAITKIGDH
ncbi:Phenylalanine-4-hydroxylase [Hypsibius exemplaris]|uniref:phenylalanine 4-monooxygenase n=1 Tax=Hypsibius exemplaris TaxID=2072580 RepID=A0A1W0XDB1_HYPEX|nr:Phenylalanine-4-hydroxylase [Hypsibius exemplaris]